MNDRRSLLVAVSCPCAVLAGWLALSLSAYAPALIENSGANAAAVLRAKDLTRLDLADVPRAVAIEDGVALTADIAAAVAAAPAPAMPEEPAGTIQLASADPLLILPTEAAPTPLMSPEPESIVSEAVSEAAVSDTARSETTLSETTTPAATLQPVKLASADPTEIVATDAPSSAAIASGPLVPASKASPPADTVAVLDECFVIEACVDRYLWALYQRTAKEDTMKVQERRAVTVKRKGKTVTVMRSFTKLVDQDFTWKDPKAAERAGMSMMDYVIGGMDKSFKLKLFRMMLAAEAAGLSPGITSAFRDDYRQSIASGLKAASNRSYHGGSTRGGYGHGMAADIVSTQGNNRAQRWVSTEILWKWVDANGKAYGIGRPYLGRDPPHVGPIDGPEYISKRGTADRKDVASAQPKKPRAVASAKPPKAHATGDQKSPAKPQKSAQSAPKRAT